MEGFIRKLTAENLRDFFILFSKDKCEKCYCTFYFCAENIDNWVNMTMEEAKDLRESITSKCSDGYIYYINNEPAAWCQCVSPKHAPYLKNLLDIKSDDYAKVISCFFVKEEYRGKGLIKTLLQEVIAQCESEGIKALYGIPVFEDFLKTVDEDKRIEKLHTGRRELFELYDFICIGNTKRYYFMKKELNRTIEG